MTHQSPGLGRCNALHTMMVLTLPMIASWPRRPDPLCKRARVLGVVRWIQVDLLQDSVAGLWRGSSGYDKAGPHDCQQSGGHGPLDHSMVVTLGCTTKPC